jgi:hypothetical protein
LHKRGANSFALPIITDGHANLPNMAAAGMKGKGVHVNVAGYFTTLSGNQAEDPFWRVGQTLAPGFGGWEG